MSYADFHDAVNDIMDQLKSKLGISNAIVRRLEGDELKTVAYFGYGEEEANLRIFVGQGITGLCAKENRIVVINDLKSYSGQYLSGIDNARSEVCAPIVAGGRLVGTFNIESPYPGNFTQDKIDTIVRMAGMLATNVAGNHNPTSNRLAKALAALEAIA